MSAGEFQSAFYELSAENGGGKARCRVQPETLAATIGGTANIAAGGPATLPSSAVVSRGRRSRGISMRTVTLRWTGEPPAGYDGKTVTIPVLTVATFTAWVLEGTGTYLATPCKVVGRTPEAVR